MSLVHSEKKKTFIEFSLNGLNLKPMDNCTMLMVVSKTSTHTFNSQKTISEKDILRTILHLDFVYSDYNMQEMCTSVDI